jgi:hypothetical protein
MVRHRPKNQLAISIELIENNSITRNSIEAKLEKTHKLATNFCFFLPLVACFSTLIVRPYFTETNRFLSHDDEKKNWKAKSEFQMPIERRKKCLARLQ